MMISPTVRIAAAWIATASIFLELTATRLRAQTANILESGSSTTWSGAYAGLLVGMRSARNQEVFSPGEEAVPKPNAAAVVGYNWQFNALVVGVEGEASRAERYAASAAARARLGVAIGPSLIYGTTGLVWTRDYGTDVSYFDGANKFSITENAAMQGRSIGGGVELKLSPGWGVRAEAVRTSFPQTMVTFSAIGMFSEMKVPVRFEETSIRVGALYQLGAKANDSGARNSGGADWHGPYAGLDGGTHLRDFHVQPVSGTWHGTVYNDASWLTFAGIHAGYLWQSGAVVAGLEADLAVSNAERPTQMALARLGYAWRSHLAYVTAGVARSAAELNEYHNDETLKKHHLGGVYGLGVETQLDKSLSLRLEALQFYGSDARYEFHGTMRCRYSECLGIGSPPRNARFDDQIVRAGISFHFD